MISTIISKLIINSMKDSESVYNQTVERPNLVHVPTNISGAGTLLYHVY